MINTFHAQCSDGGLTLDDVNAFSDAEDTYFSSVSALISAHTRLDETRYYNMPATAGPLGDPAFVKTRTGYVFSGSVSATLPPQVAISHTLKTAIRRRWGRIYLGGLVTACMDDARVSSGALSTLGTAFDAWGTTLRDAGQGLVVWHRATWAAQDVQDWTIDDVFDVIRRRRFDNAFNRASGSFTS
jgi:hypothetical protein